MIQRLGTHFPEAGGAMGSGVRDLQMTTIDPHDFEQPSLSLAGFGFPTFYEPEIQVWENVTFADNYYQTVPQLNEPTATPAGRAIPDADLNVFLGGTVQPEVSGNVRREDSRAGFTRETDAILGLGRGAVHGRTVSWYDGTVDLSETEAPEALYRRLGDGFHEHLFDPDLANHSEFESGLANPWYVPDRAAANFAFEDESAPHEGIGTGWFYSVLGGGKDLRPEARLDRRQPVTFDNTNGRENRGDFAVPTVFNGNFDITTAPDSPLASFFNREEAIPGWSFHNGDTFTSSTPSSPLASRLVDLKDVAGLADHLEKSGNKPNSPEYQTDFALNLQDGDSIVHNRIFIPYEGQFGFDIFVPNLADPRDAGAPGDAIKIYLGDRELKSFDPTKFSSNNGYSESDQLNANADRPAVDLRPPVIFDPLTMQGQQNRVDYGNNGFERFYVDVPEEFRGEVAPIKIEVNRSGSGEIFLDNVGFGSEHLRFGIPVLDNVKPVNITTSSEYSDNNLLVKKPQYSLSYNHQKKISNWVSWHLDKTWLGSAGRPREEFAKDITLPFSSQAEHKNYPAGEEALFDRGHLSASADRNRTVKDITGTFIMSNIVPQAKATKEPWEDFEDHLRRHHVEQQGHSVHIIAGGGGKLSDDFVEKKLKDNGIHVPYYLWKVALILKNPKLDLHDLSEMSEEELNKDVEVLSIKVPNDPITDLTSDQKDWEYWKDDNAKAYWDMANSELSFNSIQTSTTTSVETLQDELKLELFPDLPKNVKKWLGIDKE